MLLPVNQYADPIYSVSCCTVFCTVSVPVSLCLPLPSSPSQPLVCFRSLWACPLWTLPRNGIIQYAPFCDWRLRLSIGFLRFLHVVTGVRMSLLLVVEEYFVVGPHPHFIYSSIS